MLIKYYIHKKDAKNKMYDNLSKEHSYNLKEYLEKKPQQNDIFKPINLKFINI